MGLFDIFKLTEKIKRSTTKGAGATLYPNKIVIETVNKIKDSYWVISANVEILNVEVDSKTLGQTLRKHLDQSRDNLKEAQTGEYKDYLKAAGFKTGKEHHKNALHLTVDQKGDKIFLQPTINGGFTGKNRGFVGINDLIELDTKITDKELGDQLRTGWSKCVQV